MFLSEGRSKVVDVGVKEDSGVVFVEVVGTGVGGREVLWSQRRSDVEFYECRF